MSGHVSRHYRNVFKGMMRQKVGDIDSTIHISGDVYVATVTGDVDHPLILLDKSEGVGLFNPEQLFDSITTYWFMLSLDSLAAMNISDCDYCGRENKPCTSFRCGVNKVLCAPFKKDDGELENEMFEYEPSEMCEDCLHSLLGVLRMREDTIWHTIASASI